jgi:hypothetical protein
MDKGGATDQPWKQWGVWAGADLQRTEVEQLCGPFSIHEKSPSVEKSQ